MMQDNFTLASSPSLHFGVGSITQLPSLIAQYGSSSLVVVGSGSFTKSLYYQALEDKLSALKLSFDISRIGSEPTPEMIDAVVSSTKKKYDVVVAIGGGSVLDAGKAISAMLPLGGSVMDYLEDVGTKSHPGIKVPFIAVPTTAGTGSEGTKNAVLSRTGKDGFKKSLRHDNFVPDIALIDPALAVGCPRPVTASSGMDAFTQLLESYVSTKANAITDILALEGFRRIARSLLRAYADPGDLNARTDMALAAYLSGVTLANAGLGLVHGFASVIGGNFNIGHGTICSALMAPSNKVTVKLLRARQTEFQTSLKKYAIAGKVLCGKEGKTDEYYVDQLLTSIGHFAAELKIPTLSELGILREDLPRIAANSGNKNNPILLGQEEMEEVLAEAY